MDVGKPVFVSLMDKFGTVTHKQLYDLICASTSINVPLKISNELWTPVLTRIRDVRHP